MMETSIYNCLLGKTFSAVKNNGDQELVFEVDGKESFKFYHDQSCCESVTIEDIVGDLSDLVGSPLTMAECVTSRDNPKKRRRWDGDTEPEEEDESHTWTFYKFATVKGYVTVRWYGHSSGWYSEEVDFSEYVNGRWKDTYDYEDN